MSEALCQCGHAEGRHIEGRWCRRLPCACQRFTSPPTREPIRLTDEAEAAFRACRFTEQFYDSDSRAFVAGFLAARLAGGPTLADAWDEGFDKGAHYASADLSHATYRTPPPANPYRTPESEDD